MLIAYITNKNKTEAKKIAKHLLSKKLTACANIFPTNSLYFWKGKLKNDKEFILICKTTESKFSQLENEVKKIHSYEIPCIIKINAQSNSEYENWLQKQLEVA